MATRSSRRAGKDARDQLVAEATRVRNRIHALLVAIAPGYHEQVLDLTTSAAPLVLPSGLVAMAYAIWLPPGAPKSAIHC